MAHDKSVTLEVPGTPPSVNHYARHTRTGKHYLMGEAAAFKYSVYHAAKGRSVDAKKYAVAVTIYLGHNQKGDIDNFLKVTLDALVYAKVIKTDAAIMSLQVLKHRDASNPRTIITVEPFER